MRGLLIGRAPRLRPAVLALALVALLIPATGAAQTTVRDHPELAPVYDGLARALARGRLTEAEYALERARALYRPERARRLFGDVATPDPRAGQAILRDLAARRGELAPAQRAAAERILARPTDRGDAIHGYRARARRTCGTQMCFWWVTRTHDAPSLVDRNRNRVPDWVDLTRATFGRVWLTQVREYRYRAPLNDRRSRSHGPNGKLDIYIADVGAEGLYGYCTTDDPRGGWRLAVSAYCVVDDDFARRQFEGGAIGRQALEVTAAHEFFHAVQYAYDWREDLWFMEGTAAWIEDEVYDDVNDNRQYLRTSPLSSRLFWYSLDWYDPDPGDPNAGFKYGVWIFWRYLSERFGRDVVRETWERAAVPGTYSLKGLAYELRARGADLGPVFSDFGVANLYPAISYSEGAEYPAPRPDDEKEVTIDGVGHTPIWLSHLANDYYEFFAADELPAESVLTFTLELPPPESSPSASAVVEQADETIVRIPAVYDEVALRWRIVVPEFGSTRRVTLVLTNASRRFVCRKRTVYSCRGRPLDDPPDDHPNFTFRADVSEPAPAPAP
jgi:hypothetical protein